MFGAEKVILQAVTLPHASFNFLDEVSEPKYTVTSYERGLSEDNIEERVQKTNVTLSDAVGTDRTCFLADASGHARTALSSAQVECLILSYIGL